jgi:hypothetical protein
MVYTLLRASLLGVGGVLPMSLQKPEYQFLTFFVGRFYIPSLLGAVGDRDWDAEFKCERWLG